MTDPEASSSQQGQHDMKSEEKTRKHSRHGNTARNAFLYPANHPEILHWRQRRAPAMCRCAVIGRPNP